MLPKVYDNRNNLENTILFVTNEQAIHKEYKEIGHFMDNNTQKKSRKWIMNLIDC